MTQRVLVGLIGLGAVLAATIGLELSGGLADDGGMIPTAPRPSIPRPQAAAPLVQDGRLDGVLARPLFVAGRRPAAGPAAVAAAPASLPRLSGIMVDGLARSAIFAAAAGGRPVVARVGAQVGAFTVQSIEAGQVTLIGPGGPQVLRPSFDPRAPSPGAPPGAAAPFGAGATTDVMQSLRGSPGFSAPAPR